jgi:antirestriction protein
MTTETINKRPACIATGCPDVGVYVACLASYNSGRLHGAWIDLEADVDEDDLQEAIAWVLNTSPTPGAEEYAIHDSCGLPSFLACNEWPDLSQLVAYADGVSAVLDADEVEAYRLACDDQHEVLDYDQFREMYRGCYSSGEDYAQELAEELGSVPADSSWPVTCIDWTGAWRELTFDSYYAQPCSSGGVHIFRSA